MEFVAPQRWVPTPYMISASKFLVERGAAGLLLDPGMRKTSITLAAIRTLMRRKIVGKTLVIAPLRPCYLVWPKEVRKWVEFADLRVEVLHGPGKDEALRRDADVYVVNPDGLPWLLGARDSGKVDMRRWKSLGLDCLVVDELSKFKNPRTKRFKLLKQVLDTFKRRYGLTGSPAANGLQDLFGQTYVLDQGQALGRYVTHFRLEYFDPVPYTFEWRIKPDGEERIRERIRPLCLSLRAEDHVDMPTVQEVRLAVELPDDARRAYDEMEDELLTQVEGSDVTAASAAVASGKCRQIASGAVYLDEAPETFDSIRGWRLVHEAKVEALVDLVEELQGQQLLVAYEFRHDLERIRSALGPETPALGGGTSMSESRDIEEAWNRGDLRTLLVHPQAAGHGLNLQGQDARHVCWFTPTWDYELYDQLVRRIRRSGNAARVVFVHHIVAAGTIDEAVLGALRAKRKGQNALMEALRNMRVSRQGSRGRNK